MMPRDSSLSDSYESDRCFFESGDLWTILATDWLAEYLYWLQTGLRLKTIPVCPFIYVVHIPGSLFS